MHHTSASQVSMFLRCNRRWFWTYVMKMRSPPSEAQLRGLAVHKVVENYFNHGVMPDAPKEGELDLRPYVEAAIKYVHRNQTIPLLPEPEPGPDRSYLVEHKFVIPTREGLPDWLGFIDFFHDVQPIRRCPDFKTMGSLRSAKTPIELSKDPQMMSYAKWAYMAGHQGPLEVGHFCIETRMPPPKKAAPRILYVPLVVVEDTVNEYWNETALPAVERMTTIEAGPKEISLIDPNDEACGDHGGCPHRERCGLEKNVVTFGRKTTKGKGTEMGNPMLEKLKNAKLAAADNGTSAAPVAAVVPAVVAAQAQAPEAQPTIPTFVRARMAAVPPQEVQPANAATLAAVTAQEPVKAVKPKAAPRGAKGGFELYIDCQPVVGGKPAVPFEVWFAPIEEAVGQILESEGKPANIMRLDFGEQKAVIADAVRANLDEVPGALCVSTSNNIGKDALNVLIPHASRVVRSIR
ncbi:MAG: PD-(D/E)XK nuclease family protein [Deltaproteobacteria bacterium]|nr:PD-(D/E)XK nuclease family protein [Deltaproteobacteria bacterium]